MAYCAHKVYLNNNGTTPSNSSLYLDRLLPAHPSSDQVQVVQEAALLLNPHGARAPEAPGCARARRRQRHGNNLPGGRADGGK